MTKTYKAFLATGILALPLAMAQAQTDNMTSSDGAAADGSVPVESVGTPKSPPMTTPPATETATGEGTESSKPGTDQPLSTTTPAEVGSIETETTPRPSSTAGTPQETAPSGETPPRGAPMRTGQGSASHDGSSTIQGEQDKQ